MLTEVDDGRTLVLVPLLALLVTLGLVAACSAPVAQAPPATRPGKIQRRTGASRAMPPAPTTAPLPARGSWCRQAARCAQTELGVVAFVSYFYPHVDHGG